MARTRPTKEERTLSPEWSEKFKCGVLSISYDVATHTGYVHFPEGHCCDKEACIAFFKMMDAGVQIINTFSGGLTDTSYRLIDGEWEVFAHFLTKPLQ